MSIFKVISKYTFIVVVWVFLAVFVAWIQYSTSDLSASVLSLTEKDFFDATKWDAWYKKENQVLEIFLAEQIRNEWILTISIISSPETERLINLLETPYSISDINQNEGSIILNIDWYENWDFREWILQLPYSWDSKDITLEYIRSQNLNFAIWNLDNINQENQSH